MVRKVCTKKYKEQKMWSPKCYNKTKKNLADRQNKIHAHVYQTLFIIALSAFSFAKVHYCYNMSFISEIIDIR